MKGNAYAPPAGTARSIRVQTVAASAVPDIGGGLGTVSTRGGAGQHGLRRRTRVCTQTPASCVIPSVPD